MLGMEKIPKPNPLDSIGSVRETESVIKIRRSSNIERGTVLEYVTVDTQDVLSESFTKNLFELLDSMYDNEDIDNKTLIKKTLCLNENNENLKSLVDVIRKFTITEQNIYNKHLFLHLPGYYLTIKKAGKKIILLPTRLIHNITGSTRKMSGTDRDLINRFEDLNNILNLGFKSPSATIDGRHLENAYMTGDNDVYGHNSFLIEHGDYKNAIIDSDKYSISFISNDKASVSKYSGSTIEENGYEFLFDGMEGVRSSSPSEILSVNVFMQEGLDEDKKKEKVNFYKDNIFNQFKVPVRFFTLGIDGKKTRVG